jgi:selenocysteine lyase/cysteine desulfurase
VAAFVGCPPGSSVIFVRNTTEAANVLAAALPRDSVVLCSPFEHRANLLPWRVHDVRHLAFQRSAEDFLEELERALGSASLARRPVDLVAVTGASIRVPGAVRASIGIGVTAADVESLLGALELIAAGG